MKNEVFHPVYIEWEVTSDCNFSCKHCYNHWRRNKELDKKNNKRNYLEIAQKISESSPVHVTITGGEPFLVFEHIKDAIDLLINNNIHVSINTNLSLLNDEIISFIKEREIPLFVSLISANKTICDEIAGYKDSFLLVSKNIKKVLSEGIELATNMVVSKINFDTIFETAEFVVNELGLKYFCATKASFPENAEKEFKEKILNLQELNEMLNQLVLIKNKFNVTVDTAWAYSFCGFSNNEIIKNFAFRRKCSAGRLSFSINSNGDVYACPSDKYSYGNIHDYPFLKIISKMVQWQDDSLKPEECNNCEDYEFCGGGCRMDALYSQGSIKKLDSNSNIENIERKIKYPEIEDSRIRDIKNKKFELNREVKVLIEKNCVRLNVGKDYAFVSSDFFNYIKNKKTFNIRELASKCDEDDDNIVYALIYLIDSKIIYSRKGDEDNENYFGDTL